jgi:amino acid permease
VDFFSSILENIFSFLATDPSVLLLQILLIFAAFLIIYFVLFVTRDIILRSHSFLFQAFCILLSAIPVFGFLLYFLIRPSETLRQQSMRHELHHVSLILEKMTKHQEARKQKQTKQK